MEDFSVTRLKMLSVHRGRLSIALDLGSWLDIADMLEIARKVVMMTGVRISTRVSMSTPKADASGFNC
jgi:hypothetical protein